MATAKQPVPAETSHEPRIAFRSRGISVAVFANEVETADGRKVIRYNISVHRRYRDGDEYKSTSSFRRDDLPIVQLLTQRAWEFIVDHENDRGAEDSETE